VAHDIAKLLTMRWDQAGMGTASDFQISLIAAVGRQCVTAAPGVQEVAPMSTKLRIRIGLESSRPR